MYIINGFAQNTDFGYSLESPRRDGSNDYPQSMFWIKNKNVQFTVPLYIPVSLYRIGVQGV